MDESQIVDDSLPLILLGVIGMLLLAVAVVVFFIVYQKRLFIQQDQIKSLETAYQKDLLASNIQAQEKERKRIAIDLHDGLGSLLSTIRLYVLQFKANKSSGSYDKMVNETKSIVDTAIIQTREISHNLMPTALSRFGVIQAIEDYCKRLQRLQDIDISFAYDQAYLFDEKQNLALYRIIQELVNNTLKHTQASRIQIHLTTVASQLQLTYYDNGSGFDQASINDGLGLKSIESRVNLLNGKMNIQSAKGKGFRFKLTMEA